MNKHNNKLIKIMDLLRKDTGINNAIDAMEQLSLLLIVKYFYEVVLVDTPRKGGVGSFKGLFYNSNHSEKDDFSSDFYALRLKLNDIVNDIESSEQELEGDFLVFDIWKKIENILNFIPFKIRSTKILELALYRLDELDFFVGLEVDFDELLMAMVKDSSSSGAFHSPKSLIKAIIKVTKPLPQESIYDPAMGTGRTFVETKKYLDAESHGCGFRATGNDLSPFAYLIGTLNLLLNDVDVGEISISDSLLCSDDFKYDLIISGIPFGKVSEVSKYEYYYHGHSGNLEAMFLKHSMDKLAAGGRAAIIVPDGVLFNRANQIDVLRQQLLLQFNLHSILSLPKGTLAPYTGVKLSVLFFDNTTPVNDIWFYELNTEKPLSKSSPINDFDFEEFISLFEGREISERSFLINKNSLLNDESFDLSFSLPRKEDQIEFDKMGMIDALEKNNAGLNKLIASHFENVSRSISVEYLKQDTIENIGKLRSGEKLNKLKFSDAEKCPVYGGNGIVGYYEESNRRGDSIIIGKVGMHCGNIHFSSKPYWLTSNAISLEVIDTNNVFAPYLAHVLKSLDLNDLSTGTAQKFISITQLKKIEVSLPSYEKQVELSDWFTSLEENKSLIQKLFSEFNDELDLVTVKSISEKTVKR
jgi:type I restriction enzyme M protein